MEQEHLLDFELDALEEGGEPPPSSSKEGAKLRFRFMVEFDDMGQLRNWWAEALDCDRDRLEIRVSSERAIDLAEGLEEALEGLHAVVTRWSGAHPD